MARAPVTTRDGRRTIPWRPACMDSLEYRAWMDANADYARWRGRQRLKVLRPCVDCTADFAAEMRLEDRCNGEPGEEANT